MTPRLSCDLGHGLCAAAVWNTFAPAIVVDSIKRWQDQTMGRQPITPNPEIEPQKQPSKDPSPDPDIEPRPEPNPDSPPEDPTTDPDVPPPSGPPVFPQYNPPD